MSDKGHNLSQEDEDQIAKLFKELDRNKDGKIEIEDLIVRLKAKNVADASRHAEVIHILCVKKSLSTKLMKHDSDKDGKINLEEFLRYASEHDKKIKLFFSKMDKNKDGLIDVEEIMAAFKESGMSISKDEAENLLSSIDSDGTRKIDGSEWQAYHLLRPSDNFNDVLHNWRHSTIIDIGDNTIIPDDFTEKEMQTGMWWRHLVAGGTAGAVHGGKIEKKDKLTIRDGFRHMLKEGGVKSLWRGNGVNVIKIAPESAIKFMAYEQIKGMFRGDRKEIGPLERFAAGSSAGAISQSIIYPMEVLKTRLALRKTGQYSGMVDCAAKLFKHEGAGTLKKLYRRKNEGADPGIVALVLCAGDNKSTLSSMFNRILRNEGLKGFYRGLAPNFLKVAPAVSISYVVYESVREQLGMKMS
ncbi:SCMC2-like protein [Mya arenaria]|uniref:SCMC2-like protein n=1 Tax=Mya arenaria TaxID=6604 RepID=A0ABY7G7Y5_MYAAR|nr:SCMC2-like protein [Mya arenaria]